MTDLWPWRLLRDEVPLKLRWTAVVLGAIRKQQAKVAERQPVLARIARCQWVQSPPAPEEEDTGRCYFLEAVDVLR